MMKYDYYKAVKDDIRDYINENDIIITQDDYEEIRENLYDTFYETDDVTGNISGSYWCNAWKAEECLCHNWDLIREVCDEFDTDFEHSPEMIDVSIRLNVMGEVLDEVMHEFV